MIVEPNCDMPEWAYKDYLADQGYDELRNIDFASLVTGTSIPCYYHTFDLNRRALNGDSLYLIGHVVYEGDGLVNQIDFSSVNYRSRTRGDDSTGSHYRVGYEYGDGTI